MVGYWPRGGVGAEFFFLGVYGFRRSRSVCGTVSKRQKAAFCADSCGRGSEHGRPVFFYDKSRQFDINDIFEVLEIISI